MRINYDQEVDVLYLVLSENHPVDAIEEPGGVIVTYGEKNEPVSIEFLNASQHGLINNKEISVTLQTKQISSKAQPTI